jgi:hypothetical protein
MFGNKEVLPAAYKWKPNGLIKYTATRSCRTGQKGGLMKAHVLGFHWEFLGGYAENVTLDDLFERFKKLGNEEFEFKGYQRLVYVASEKDRIIGLLLTAKNHKRFCELRRQGKSMKINVREAEKGASLIDFNFFLIDKKSSRGLQPDLAER